MNYYISDLHIEHKNVTKSGADFDNRPYKNLEEMHKDVVERWNSKVTNGDHVYILGDFVWKETEEAIKLVASLKGNKHLILGNHDFVKDQRYKQLFVEICNYKELSDNVNGINRNLVLSHFPIMFWNKQHMERSNYAIHLYGHLHRL